MLLESNTRGTNFTQIYKKVNEKLFSTTHFAINKKKSISVLIITDMLLIFVKEKIVQRKEYNKYLLLFT